MKKFIFGAMLLVSLLGFVGCSMDSSDSDDPIVGNAVYRVKNGTNFETTFSYKNKSNGWTDVKIPADGIYKILASDVKINIETVSNPFTGETGNAPMCYLKIKSDAAEKETSYPEKFLKEGIKITYISSIGYFINTIENAN